MCGIPAILMAEHPPINVRTQERLRQDVQYLSADRLQGRGPQTGGLQLAAQYIAKQFGDAGLKTDLVDGKPLQPVWLNSGTVAGESVDNHVLFNIAGQEPIGASLDSQMRPMSIGSDGQVDGPLVFAGYGVTARSANYDNYQGINAKDAIVMILRKLPVAPTTSAIFKTKEGRQHKTFDSKIRNAIRHGAKAVLLVNDAKSIRATKHRLQRRIDDESKRITKLNQSFQKVPLELVKIRESFKESLENAHQQLNILRQQQATAIDGLLGVDQAISKLDSDIAIPVASLSRPLADQILEKVGGMSLDAFEQQAIETQNPPSFRFNEVRVQVKTSLKQDGIDSANVVACLPGQGALKDETVIIGAHYDHLGMGGPRSNTFNIVDIHNGADDNASGTSALLELGRLLPTWFTKESNQHRPHRRILFIAFTGEEMGLLGSKHYVKQPLFPLATTVAMINLDMIGRLRNNRLTVYGTGTAQEFEGILTDANQHQQFRISRFRGGEGPSDHETFYRKQIPVLFFFTGLHQDYHRPSDDSDKIQFNGMRRITDIVSRVVFQISTQPQRPTFQSIHNRDNGSALSRPYLGISMRNLVDRVVISKIAKDSPAERGGLAIEDRFVSVAGNRITSSRQIQQMVQSRKPGQIIKIQVRRKKQVLSFAVVLDQKP